MTRTKVLLLTVPLLLLLGSCGLVAWWMLDAMCGNWAPDQVQKSQAIGNTIFAAIEAYALDHEGHVPDSLNQLVPKYLPNIAPPTAGD